MAQHVKSIRKDKGKQIANPEKIPVANHKQIQNLTPKGSTEKTKGATSGPAGNHADVNTSASRAPHGTIFKETKELNHMVVVGQRSLSNGPKGSDEGATVRYGGPNNSSGSFHSTRPPDPMKQRQTQEGTLHGVHETNATPMDVSSRGSGKDDGKQASVTDDMEVVGETPELAHEGNGGVSMALD